MKSYQTYFVMLLLTISILQPGCKHDHPNQINTKQLPVHDLKNHLKTEKHLP